MDAEEAVLAGEFLDVFAGLDSEVFERLALVADEDGFLRLALDEDEARNVVDAVAFLVAFDSHFAAVGNLFLVEEEYFLAHYLADKEAHGAVGEFVLGEVGLVLGQLCDYVVEYGAYVEAFGGAAGHHEGARYLSLPVGDAVGDKLLVGEVYLVDYQNNGRIATDDALEGFLILCSL